MAIVYIIMIIYNLFIFPRKIDHVWLTIGGGGVPSTKSATTSLKPIYKCC